MGWVGRRHLTQMQVHWCKMKPILGCNRHSADIPVVGTHATYWDGGYYVTFSNITPTAVLATVARLEPSGWIDRYTRAVFIEMTIYNPHANLFSVVNLLTEFTTVGNAYPHVDITTVRLYRFQTFWAWVVVGFQGVFIIFTLYFAFREMDHIVKLRSLYLKTFWGCVELSLAILSLAEVGVMLYTLYIVLEFQSKQGANTGPVEKTFEKYRRAAYWGQINTYLLGCLVCVGTLKLLHLLRFNKHVVLGADTIKKAAGPLSGFFLIFTLVFLAFAMFAALVFGPSEEGFSPFIATLETMLTILLGKFYEMSDRKPIMGPLFTFSFITFFQWVIVTMVVAILDCAIHEVAEENSQQKPETEQVADLMLERLQSWAGGLLQRGKGRSSAVIKETYKPTEEELTDFLTNADFIRFRGQQENSSTAIEFCIENQMSRCMSSPVIKETYNPSEEELTDFLTNADCIRFSGQQDNSSTAIEFCIENQMSLRSSSVIKETYNPTEEELTAFLTNADIRLRGRQENSSTAIEFCIEHQMSSATA
ncbi:polycystin-2-like [Branchiostoma floridae]|uniref:Polycystin-2-like n=1 Tax=Branchiostoma floridae TaxID=7739 RepID=A0A9J7LEF6_BRAFL|nr:polycystin-2-like [Branchiostoma floridae]